MSRLDLSFRTPSMTFRIDSPFSRLVCLSCWRAVSAATCRRPSMFLRMASVDVGRGSVAFPVPTVRVGAPDVATPPAPAPTAATPTPTVKLHRGDGVRPSDRGRLLVSAHRIMPAGLVNPKTTVVTSCCVRKTYHWRAEIRLHRQGRCWGPRRHPRWPASPPRCRSARRRSPRSPGSPRPRCPLPRRRPRLWTGSARGCGRLKSLQVQRVC